MNKIRIILVGLAAISAASLCSAIAAAPPPVVAEKVIGFDAAVGQLPSLEFAVRDFEMVSVPIAIEREAVSYAVRQSSIAAGRTGAHATRSASARTCCAGCNCSLKSATTDYEQRM